MALTYGLIVSDFDGTLRRTEGGISERNVRAIGRYVDAGGVFAFCTGRMLSSIMPYAKELGLKGLVAAYQGATIADIESGALLREFPFRRFAAAQMPLVQVFIQHRAHGGAQLRIDLGEPFGHVLMHGRFARTEVFGAGAHRCVRLQNVLRRAPRAALHILPHLHHPPSGDDTFYVGSCKLMTNGRMRRSLFVPRSL